MRTYMIVGGRGGHGQGLEDGGGTRYPSDGFCAIFPRSVWWYRIFVTLHTPSSRPRLSGRGAGGGIFIRQALDRMGVTSLAEVRIPLPPSRQPTDRAHLSLAESK